MCKIQSTKKHDEKLVAKNKGFQAQIHDDIYVNYFKSLFLIQMIPNYFEAIDRQKVIIHMLIQL